MKPSFSRTFFEAVLLSLVSCVVIYALFLTQFHESVGLLAGFFCILSIALPLTHLIWYLVRKDLYRFQNSPWPTIENTMQRTVDPQNSRKVDIVFHFAGVGSQMGMWNLFPPESITLKPNFPLVMIQFANFIPILTTTTPNTCLPETVSSQKL